MPAITEIARAKVNLTLHVGAALTDGQFKGYHPLDSLVVFADFGDEVTFVPSDNPAFEIKGEFAGGLEFDADNLILKALKAAQATPRSVMLTKNIPVSAGLGGGSANAAAVLRQFDQDWRVNDAAMGADIPVCRLSQTAFMRGIGEKIESIRGLGQIHAVLINPRKAVSTAEIFKAFDSEARPKDPTNNAMTGTLLERALEGTNDLQAIAKTIEPSIGEVLTALENTNNCNLARMSGSGATCFGLYETSEAAKSAATQIKSDHPDWWAKACLLGDPK